MTDKNLSRVNPSPTVHNPPPPVKAVARLTPGQIGAFGTIIIDLILAQFCIAIGGIDIFGIKPFEFLYDWADNLQNEAANAYKNSFAVVDVANNQPVGTTTSGTLNQVYGAAAAVNAKAQSGVDDAYAANVKATTAQTDIDTKAKDFSNLAAGSNFEDDKYPWTLGTGWSIASDDSYTGTKSLKYTAQAANNYFCTLKTSCAVKEGEQLYIEFYAKKNASYNGTTESILRIANQSNTRIGQVSFASSALSTTAWTKRSTTFQVGAGVTALQFLIGTDCTAGAVWIDEIVIRRVVTSDTVATLPQAKVANLTTDLPAAKEAGDNADIKAQATIDNIGQAIDGLATTGRDPVDLLPSVVSLQGLTSTGPNLVVSPDFEDSTINRYGLNLGAGSGYSTTQKYTGTQSWKATNATAGLNIGFHLNPSVKQVSTTKNDTAIKVRPGQSFYLEVWVYYAPSITSTASQTFVLNCQGNDGGANTFNQTALSVSVPKNTWTKLSVTYTVPSTFQFINMWVLLRSTITNNNDAFYIDCATIRQETFAQAAIDGIHNAYNGGSTQNNAPSTVQTNVAGLNQKAADGATGASTNAATIESTNNYLVDAYSGTTGSTGQTPAQMFDKLQPYVESNLEFLRSGTNLIPDPSFENTKLDTTRAALLANANAGTWKYYSGSGANSGTRALWFAATASSGSSPTFSVVPSLKSTDEGVPVSGGEVFYMSAYVDASNANPTATASFRFQLYCYDSKNVVASSFPGSTQTVSKNINGWTFMEAYLRVPTTGVNRVKFQFVHPAGTFVNGDNLFWDDLTVSEVTASADTWNAVVDGLEGTTGSTNKTPSNVYTTAAGARQNTSDATTTASTAVGNNQLTNTAIVNAIEGSGGDGTSTKAQTALENLTSRVINGYTVVSRTSGTSWTRPWTTGSISAPTEFWVVCVAGGGGGGAGKHSGGTSPGGTGGAGGGYAVARINVADVPSTVTYSLGAGASGRLGSTDNQTPVAGNQTTFGTAGSACYLTTLADRAFIASIYGYQGADDSMPGAGGTGGTATAASVAPGSAGGSTPLAAGGAGGPSSNSGTAVAAGGTGATAPNSTANYRAGGGGGGGGGAVIYTLSGTATRAGNGGNGGFPGGGGGGGGGWFQSASGTSGGNGGNGAGGAIYIIYR